MNVIENKNFNHLATPRLPPYYATAFAMIYLQKRQIFAVAGPLLAWCRKNRSSTYRTNLWYSRTPSRNLFG